MKFPTDYKSILEWIGDIEPHRYSRTRNFIDGDVTYLSPYISRGVISTKFVAQKLRARGFDLLKAEKLTQELAWRDYWQQVWLAKAERINNDLKRPQERVASYGFPRAFGQPNTGIQVMDRLVNEFIETGYMHNHVRMYTASIICNLGQYHWKKPAQWMYYHLLDADWASNALSWQWVAGCNSAKKYYANQENINKYCHADERNTYLDLPYPELVGADVPVILRAEAVLDLKTPLPESAELQINPVLPTAVYNMYNLDPNWRSQQVMNRILLFEPRIFETYPIGQKTIDFIIDLSRNIEGIQTFTGSFEALLKRLGNHEIYYKEHPLNTHYTGYQDPRDWLFTVQGYFPSFFKFWNTAKQHWS